MYKIETYIPHSSLQKIRDTLLSVDAGHIGKLEQEIVSWRNPYAEQKER